MNALPTTAFGAAGLWNRSSQPDSDEGGRTVRSRVRRQRAFSDRRSARDSKPVLLDRTQDRCEASVGFQAVRCPRRSRRPPGSEGSPPAPSEHPASPGHPPREHAGGSPRRGHWRGSDRDTLEAQPARSGRCLSNPTHTGTRVLLVPPSRTPLVMVLDSHTEPISLILQGQRGQQFQMTRTLEFSPSKHRPTPPRYPPGRSRRTQARIRDGAKQLLPTFEHHVRW